MLIVYLPSPPAISINVPSGPFHFPSQVSVIDDVAGKLALFTLDTVPKVEADFLSSHAVSNNIDDNMSIHNVGCFISFSLGALCYCFDIGC